LCFGLLTLAIAFFGITSAAHANGPKQFLRQGWNRVLHGVGLSGNERAAVGSTAASSSSSSATSSGVMPVPSVTSVGTNQFCNSTSITIPTSGASSPYPSGIVVSGLAGRVSKVTLSLTGFSHVYPVDLDLMLVGPGGQKFVFWASAGGITPGVTNRNVTLDDAAASAIPNLTTFSSGTYKPASYFATNLDFPAPAPARPYNRAAPNGTGTFALFNDVNPNGTWNLYVVDWAEAGAGSISGGWCLNITTVPANTTITNLTATPNPSLTGPDLRRRIYSQRCGSGNRVHLQAR
jgi:hypothetical protein